MTTADGRLIGPYNTFLLHPEVAAKFLEFSAAEKTHTTLSQREHEMVIVAVGAVWGADYELYAHCTLARNAGLSEDCRHHTCQRRYPRRAERTREDRSASGAPTVNQPPRRRRALQRGRTSLRHNRFIRHRRPDRRIPHGLHGAHPVRGTRAELDHMPSQPIRPSRPERRPPWQPPHLPTSVQSPAFRSTSSWRTLRCAPTGRSW